MISVCIATYNGEHYIKMQVQSILSQLGENDEIIVSDDNSSDNTLAIIRSFNDKRIKIIKGPCKGYIQNFSNAISHSNGDYIFLSDQDDIWIDKKISTIVPLLKNYKLALHNAEIVNSVGIGSGDVLFEGTVKFGLLKNLIYHQTYGCCLAFCADLKKIILPIPENKYLLHETWISVLAQLYFGNNALIFVNESLIKYRRHNANSSIFRKSNRSYLQRILERLVLSYYILRRYVNVKK